MSSLPMMIELKKVEKENAGVATFHLDSAVNAAPGQFVMVWLPGLDEKPFSVSALGKDFSITVKKRGAFTEKLFELKEGGSLGIRGPYGEGFKTEGVKNACVIGGGCGVAPLLPLIKELQLKKIKTEVIVGARNASEIFFEEKIKRELKHGELYITTDDGSRGAKGFATQVMEELIAKEKFDCVFACGPEVMIKKTFEICEKHGVEFQASLERYMRCGFGVCGACNCSGQLVCKDGPVFHSEQLRKMSEFGSFARTKSGLKVGLAEYC
ncbi:MAG: dihydroorotate dehydrogenase electron transfer subunit [Candidatus Diapherotrites archaeon]